jgi:hypothetical protein
MPALRCSPVAVFVAPCDLSCLSLLRTPTGFGRLRIWLLMFRPFGRCVLLFAGMCAARFSPDDKFSKERVTIKKRFGILPTQKAPIKY